jgi:hypothetical protein
LPDVLQGEDEDMSEGDEGDDEMNTEDDEGVPLGAGTRAVEVLLLHQVH